MDERDLAGLLYRADWTRLALTGTVRGSGWVPDTTFTHHWRTWDTGPRSHRFPLPDPPDWIAESIAEPSPGERRSLVLAPGRRYRVTGSAGSRVVGCDGERVWQSFADLPADTEVKFDRRPSPPVPWLLAPAWLLLGCRLTAGAETTVAGRAGITVTGVARPGPPRGRVGSTLLPWGLVERPARVTAVIDAEFGIVLRGQMWPAEDSADDGADPEADVTEFLSLEFGGPADPSVFTAPAGSFFGDGPGSGRGPDGRAVEDVSLAALKMVGGLAAGGLGAAVKYAPKRHSDPFAAATAEDPDDAMPGNEPLPGWAADAAADQATGGTDDAEGRWPVSDEVLDLLYRGGLDPVPFSGTLHEWTDAEVVAGSVLRAVPESARRAGFGGFGFLLDTVLADERDAGYTGHTVYRVRVGGWNKYRVDREHRAPLPVRRLRVPKHDGVLTIACDGERTFTVTSGEVRVGPASVVDEGPHGDLLQFLDGSWLLTCRLSGGEAVEVDGRPGYRVIATAGTGPAMGPPLSWLPAWWLPAVAVVDASSGRLLRLTRYRDGQVATQMELRSVSDGGPDDFGFTPPEGLPVVEEPRRRSAGAPGDDDAGSERTFFGPDGWPSSPPEELRAVVDAVKEQVDAGLSAARGFFDSFLGGGRR